MNKPMNHMALVMRMIRSLLSGCAKTPVTGGGQVIPRPDDSILEAYDRSLTGSFNALGLKLLHHLFDDEDNVLLSPNSISTALSVPYDGANGTTKKAMEECLASKALTSCE